MIGRLAPLVLASLGVLACKPPPGGETERPDASMPTGDDATASDGTPPGDDAEPRCASDGAPWDGKAEGCLYEHDGCCYRSPESLCAAAGCTADACRILESSPAQARCD